MDIIYDGRATCVYNEIVNLTEYLISKGYSGKFYVTAGFYAACIIEEHSKFSRMRVDQHIPSGTKEMESSGILNSRWLVSCTNKIPPDVLIVSNEIDFEHNPYVYLRLHSQSRYDKLSV